VRKSQQTQIPQSRSGRTATILSIFAILISSLSWWEAHEARTLNYESSLPNLSATVNLLDTIKVAQPLHFDVRIDNSGKTPARHMNPLLSFKFQRANIAFEASYPANAPPPRTSDLAPGAHTDLVTMNPLNLEHDHDVVAVLSGQYILYLFGKITYEDVLNHPHEFHFCRYYQPLMPTEPTKLALCPIYNDSY
jgi:hypothetical protein